MTTPEDMLQAFGQMLAAQQAQTVDMVNGLQRQFQEVMQSVVAGMPGAGKGGTQEGLKISPKLVMYTGQIYMYAVEGQTPRILERHSPSQRGSVNRVGRRARPTNRRRPSGRRF